MSLQDHFPSIPHASTPVGKMGLDELEAIKEWYSALEPEDKERFLDYHSSEGEWDFYKVQKKVDSLRGNGNGVAYHVGVMLLQNWARNVLVASARV